MDELIRNLKTRELKKQQEQEKKEVKKGKSLALKASKIDWNEQDTDVSYWANVIVISMKKKWSVSKKWK